MKFSKYMMAIAASSLAAAPALAAPTAPAGSLSLNKALRVGGSSKHAEKFVAGGLLIALLAAGALAAGIVVVADNKDKPDSA